jgi:predicted DNA-binding protein with PD1-like motif
MIVSRMMPGDDLKQKLEDLMVLSEFKSGIIVCMVGSLNNAVLRMSDGNNKKFMGLFEIVSALGTISMNGVHVHIAISDSEGMVYGGHLLKGCKIHTTAEIAIIESEINFKRIFDPSTGYKELVIKTDL